MLFLSAPQVPTPLLSPTGLKAANAPKPFSAPFSQKAAAESAAKLAQRKADEETQRRIREWKAQQQAKEVSYASRFPRKSNFPSAALPFPPLSSAVVYLFRGCQGLLGV